MAQNQYPANGTSNAEGELTITFPSVNSNSEFTGVVSIPNAPNTSQTGIYVNDQLIATVGGSSQYGALQLNDSDTLTLIGTGFTPDTQYQGLCNGVVVYGTGGPAIPTPTASQVEAALIGTIEATTPPATPIYGPLAITSGTPFVVDIPPDVRTLIIETIAADKPTAYTVVGNVTGFQYFGTNGQLPYLYATGTDNSLVVIDLFGVIDTSVTITETIAGSATVTVYGDTLLYDESSFYNGVPFPIANALAAAGTVLLTTGPCRILSAVINTSATDASITIGGVQVMRATTQMNQTWSEGLLVQSGAAVQGVQVGAGASNYDIVIAYP